MGDNVLIQAAAATTFVKVLIDLLKTAWQAPRWVPPTLAVVLGPGAVVLLLVADNKPLDQAALAGAILAGIMAGGTAIGVTELQKRTLPSG